MSKKILINYQKWMWSAVIKEKNSEEYFTALKSLASYMSIQGELLNTQRWRSCWKDGQWYYLLIILDVKNIFYQTHRMPVDKLNIFSYKYISQKMKRQENCWQYTLIMKNTKGQMVDLQIEINKKLIIELCLKTCMLRHLITILIISSTMQVGIWQPRVGWYGPAKIFQP